MAGQVEGTEIFKNFAQILVTGVETFMVETQFRHLSRLISRTIPLARDRARKKKGFCLLLVSFLNFILFGWERQKWGLPFYSGFIFHPWISIAWGRGSSHSDQFMQQFLRWHGTFFRRSILRLSGHFMVCVDASNFWTGKESHGEKGTGKNGQSRYVHDWFLLQFAIRCIWKRISVMLFFSALLTDNWFATTWKILPEAIKVITAYGSGT